MKWDAELYDNKHHFVSRYGEDLLDLLAAQPGEWILDLGCGTGHLTARIAASGARVLGIDRSAEMIARAREQYPQLDFECMDAEQLSLTRSFDAVFSNAALHWMLKPEAVLDGVRSVLKPGGRFVMEMGGRGNISHVKSAIEHVMISTGLSKQLHFPWYFPSVGAYASLLEARGFRVLYAHHFDRPTMLEGENGMYGWLTMFAAQIFAPLTETDRHNVLCAVQDRLRPALCRNGEWVVDYVRLRMIAIKES